MSSSESKPYSSFDRTTALYTCIFQAGVQLALWKKFCNYKPDRDISYKIDFYSAFSRNNLEETKYTLNFFSSLQEKCLPIIEEYSNFNFGELFSKENKSPETVKIEKLKEIIEKHEK